MPPGLRRSAALDAGQRLSGSGVTSMKPTTMSQSAAPTADPMALAYQGLGGHVKPALALGDASRVAAPKVRTGRSRRRARSARRRSSARAGFQIRESIAVLLLSGVGRTGGPRPHGLSRVRRSGHAPRGRRRGVGQLFADALIGLGAERSSALGEHSQHRPLVLVALDIFLGASVSQAQTGQNQRSRTTRRTTTRASLTGSIERQTSARRCRPRAYPWARNCSWMAATR
jgi:hypothetical protein